MCGITGYINIDLRPVRNTSAILKMLKVQKHRGPDDSGVRLFSLVSDDSAEVSGHELLLLERNFEGVLAFTRLSILNLPQTGHQPLESSDNKAFLTLNGESIMHLSINRSLKPQDTGLKARAILKWFLHST